jgi:hypothetical protein
VGTTRAAATGWRCEPRHRARRDCSCVSPHSRICLHSPCGCQRRGDRRASSQQVVFARHLCNWRAEGHTRQLRHSRLRYAITRPGLLQGPRQSQQRRSRDQRRRRPSFTRTYSDGYQRAPSRYSLLQRRWGASRRSETHVFGTAVVRTGVSWRLFLGVCKRMIYERPRSCAPHGLGRGRASLERQAGAHVIRVSCIRTTWWDELEAALQQATGERSGDAAIAHIRTMRSPNHWSSLFIAGIAPRADVFLACVTGVLCRICAVLRVDRFHLGPHREHGAVACKAPLVRGLGAEGRAKRRCTPRTWNRATAPTRRGQCDRVWVRGRRFRDYVCGRYCSTLCPVSVGSLQLVKRPRGACARIALPVLYYSSSLKPCRMTSSI